MGRQVGQQADVIRELARAVNRAGSQRAYAALVGVSDVYISYVLRGQRPPSQKLLTALGLRRSTVYERVA